MKKNRTMRAAVLMLALTLITSCFVGSTFAKYTTGISGSDTARVAKFGVELEIDADLFDTEYVDGAVSVKSDDSNNVIAPGTSKTATIFTIAGAPEVDVQVLITLNADSALSMVKLPQKNGYKDWTNQTGANTFNVATDYYPVVWTLTFDNDTTDSNPAVTKATGNLQVIETYLASISKKYEVEADISAQFESICGTYTLSWDWAFYTDAATDKMDTYIANVMAGVQTDATVVTDETFSLKITVDQVD